MFRVMAKKAKIVCAIPGADSTISVVAVMRFRGPAPPWIRCRAEPNTLMIEVLARVGPAEATALQLFTPPIAGRIIFVRARAPYGIIVVVRNEPAQSNTKLPQIADALYPLRFRLGLRKRRKQKAGEDSDGADDHEKLNERESTNTIHP